MCVNDVSQKLYTTLEGAESRNATEMEMALQFCQQYGRCHYSFIPLETTDFFAASYERLAHRERVGHTKENGAWIIRMLNSPAGWTRPQLVQFVGLQMLAYPPDAEWAAMKEWGQFSGRILTAELDDDSDAARLFRTAWD